MMTRHRSIHISPQKNLATAGQLGVLLVFLFQNLRTTDTVLIILIIVVLIAAATGIEILVPRVVLWII
jgi:hypothetical protein